MRIRRRIVLSVLGVLIALAGALGIFVYRAVRTFDVAIPDSAKGIEPGALVSVKRIAEYPAFVAQFLLSSVGLPEPIRVSHGITAYRVTYRTTNFDGTGVVASGLVALPSDGPAERVVVYHHGTIVQRKTAPSASRVGEGVLVAAAVTGNGAILVAPDYIGLGESHALHPYMCAKACPAFISLTSSYAPSRRPDQRSGRRVPFLESHGPHVLQADNIAVIVENAVLNLATDPNGRRNI